MTRNRLIVLLVVVALVGLYVKFRSPGNVAETSPAPADPGLQTRRYDIKGDLSSARKEVEQIIPTLTTYGGAWKLATHNDNPKAAFTDAEGPTLAIVRAEVPVLVFTDDLQVRLRQYAENRVAVDVKSASRVGKSDFGENRRHIRQFLAALDKHFTASAP
jgi:hypothetical protein